MRLIDADALKGKAWDADTRCGFVQVVDVADIDAAPTIELNQCKNCVHYSEDIAICYYHNRRTMPEAFCSDGERMATDETN